MTSPSGDRRVRRTRLKLQQILIEMLKKRDIKDISVLELAEQADINRGTFYLHFKDIYDLFEHIEDDIISDFSLMVTSQDMNAAGIREQLLLSVFEYLDQHTAILDVILRVDEANFMPRMLKVVKPQTDAQWRVFFPVGSPHLFEYYYTFLTSACIGLFRQWFNAGRKERPTFMAHLTMKLVSSCVNQLD